MLKKLKLVDYIIISIILIFVVIGSLAVFKKKNFANLPIEKETKINFEVFFRGITISDTVVPFNVGENAFITIRLENLPSAHTSQEGSENKQFTSTVRDAQVQMACSF